MKYNIKFNLNQNEKTYEIELYSNKVYIDNENLRVKIEGENYMYYIYDLKDINNLNIKGVKENE